jgi:mRNA-degrading endonuclease RelE of RelBE toxin-antitoxin system
LDYEVQIRPSAKRTLGRVPFTERERIRDKINDLSTTPYPVGYEIIEEGSSELLRISEGSYQIIYRVLEDEAIVDVIIIRQRVWDASS